MPARTRSIPQPVLHEAARAYAEARYADAATALEAPGPALPEEGVLLRARIFLKRDPAEALRWLSERGVRSKPARAEREMLQGVAFARLGDPKSAAARFAAAERLAPAGARLRLEIVYQRAFSAWIERKLDAAAQLLDPLETGADVALLVEIRALQGAIEGSRGNVAQQGSLLLDALRLIHQDRCRNVQHWAVVASQIAYLARELPSRSLRSAALAELPQIPWTTDIADYRFTMLRAVAWCHALEGDYFNAFRLLKEAAAAAPTPGWRTMSSCDRAYLATVLGERRWAEQELSDAQELAASIDWNALDGEERFALVILAELCAPRDPALALSFIGRYRMAVGRMARTLASSSDQRVDAMEAYSLGVVQRYLGDAGEAARLLTEAWTIYDAIGYAWRAGRAAQALSELTGDPLWQARADDKLRPYGRSWLVAGRGRPARALDAPGLSKLTRAQRDVFEYLARGEPTVAIAAAQGRSEHTVRNHIKAIYKALGVKSQAALIARVNGADAPAEAGAGR